MNKIRIVHNLPRSGGTIISKTISSQKNVILLSEIHPEGSKVRKMMRVNDELGDPLYQFQAWYKLFSEKEYCKIKSSNLNFLEKIKIIYEKTKEQNKILIIRDWSFIDYFGVPFVTPEYKNSILEILQKEFEIKNIFLVRDPLETFLSCMKLPFFSSNYTFDMFLNGYDLFINNIKKNNIIKFEKFVLDPNKNIKKISRILDFQFDENYKERFKETNITGDIDASKASMVYIKKNVASKLLSEEQKNKINKNIKYKEILNKINQFN